MQSYAVQVTLDGAWEGREASVRMDWGEGFEDFAVENGEAVIEVPAGVSRIELGVVAGRLATTNRARVKVLPSVLDLTSAMEEVSGAEWPQEEA